MFSKYFKSKFKGKAHPACNINQWITSGALWCLWIMQNAANIAVFLPRQLNYTELLAVIGIIFIGLGVIFYQKGGRIQQIVTTKTDITDVRPATIVDFIFAGIYRTCYINYYRNCRKSVN